MNQTTPRVMLLIDADNVTADVIEQAVQQVMARHGAIHVRRAYCTAELALKQLKLFKTHSIRPIVNVSTGKNSTDIALAVDAMDLVVAERPDLVVIVSSDSDFAPLVIRLREKGCRVEGIGQEGKTGEDSKPVYDAFIDLPHRKYVEPAGQPEPAAVGVKASPARKAAPAKKAAAKKAPAKKAPAKKAAAKQAPAKKAAAKRVGSPEELPQAPSRPPRRQPPTVPGRAGRTASVEVVTPEPTTAFAPPAFAPTTPELPDEVVRMLAALPELRAGNWLDLSHAKERLLRAGLLAKSAPSTKLFRKHPGLFTLTPEATPNKVQYLRPALQ